MQPKTFLQNTPLPKTEARMLLQAVTGWTRAQLITRDGEMLDEWQTADLQAMQQRRLNGEPMAYILGWREFYGRRFAVSPAVLIPRPETEHLLEAALQALPAGGSLWDLGTGSGIIAVSAKLERPDARVRASDISAEALAVARNNARTLGAAIEWALGSWFDAAVQDNSPFRLPENSRFDVIVSNPPFGAKIPIDDEEILSQYDLAAVWDQDENGDWTIRLDKHGNRVLQKSQPPEILFIERALQLLKPGAGRMAMVIPNGILNNPGNAYIRSWILKKAQVLAVVDMQRDLFQPNNDTQTSMVLMRRLSTEEESTAEAEGLDYPIFMAVAETIGHDKRGNVIWRQLPDGSDALVKRVEVVTEIDQATGNEVLREVEVTDRQVDDELPEVAEAYREWLAGQQ